MYKPQLIIVTGRPGSGKSTLSQILSKEIRCPLVSRDEIKEGYVNTTEKEHYKISEEENKKIYNVFFDTIENFLDNNITIIAEAAFQHKLWMNKYQNLALKSNITIIICKIDSESAYRRYIKRKSDDPLWEYFHGDATFSIKHEQYDCIKSPEPTLEVDTTNSYNPNIEDIILFIRKERKNCA